MGSYVELKAGGARAFGQAGLMRFRILGPLEVLSPDGWTAISAPKWRSLLACLLVRPGQLVPTDVLIDELWGDNPPNTANNLVSIYVHRLRKVIGDTEGRVLVYRAPGYMLRLAPGDLDIQQFESLVAEGRAALAAGDPGPRPRCSVTRSRCGAGRCSPTSRRPRCSTRRPTGRRSCWLTATELRIEADLACGRAAQVVPELRGLVAEHPLRERLWLLLMRALEEAGRRAEALEVYAQAREVIADELGVDPGSRAAAAVRGAARRRRVVRAAPPARPRRAGRAAPPGRSDGARRTRDRAVDGAGPRRAARTPADRRAVDRSRRRVRGGRARRHHRDRHLRRDCPSAGDRDRAATLRCRRRRLVGRPRPPSFPADIGDFTGRETHVTHLCALLLAGNAASSPGAVRIAVVNGAAGLGKTTLAVHAAHQVSAQFPDGQLYVDLLGASPQPASPGEVLARFLRDLGVEGDKVPAQGRRAGGACTGRRSPAAGC